MVRSMDLVDEIVSLIDLRQEGTYWDFKREWYAEGHEGDLLHDILCMANNLVNRDAYIIIGVDEEHDFGLCDVRNDPNRRNTQMMVTFLREKKFAGDLRPVVYVESISIGCTHLDVILIRNDINTPYYLKDRFKQVCANHIYTRIQDTNTPVNLSADIQYVELLWKKRFGLLFSPLERMQLYLQHPEDWEDMPWKGNAVRKYYRLAPEFVIEHTMEADDGRDGYEFYLFSQTDTTPHWSDIHLYYHQTLLAEFWGASLDGGRYFTPSPNTDGFNLTRYHGWDVSYKYFVKGTMEHCIHEFYYDESSGDARISHDRFMECILLFESDREHLHFKEYARKRWNEKEKYEQNIWLPCFPELKDYNMDYFKEAYVNSQILQRMLMEYRTKS